MKTFRKRLLASAAIVVTGVLALGLIAPYINASAFSRRIGHAVEGALGRPVEFTALHFTLFSGPGFTLDNVSIHEDERFGYEPFAFVPELRVRLRLDRLLLGRIAVANLRLDDPSLNLVKLPSGDWNLVQLVKRLSAPSRLPVNLFPAVEISGGRIDFKLGTRKTVLYVTDSDVSIYPEHAGKLYVRFSGSPARTDRAGNGFGHLHGSLNWYLGETAPASNQLEADITLDRSNLSELTTLVEGQDAGVHGEVLSHARVEGRFDALRVAGDLRLVDIHRWDLLPASGEDWRIPYSGTANLVAHSFALNTPSGAPVALTLSSGNYLQSIAWNVNATLKDAPVADLLPIGRRMGIRLPENVKLTGSVNGRVSFTPSDGLGGNVTVNELAASGPNTTALHAQDAAITLAGGHVRIEPTNLQTDGEGSIRISADYDTKAQIFTAAADADQFPTETLRNNLEAWLGNLPALAHFREGSVTGRVSYNSGGSDTPIWSGDIHLRNCELAAIGISAPLTDTTAHVVFDADTLTVDHLTAKLQKTALSGSYQYNASLRRPERLSVEVQSADWNDLDAVLHPASGDDGLLARFRSRDQTTPDWLRTRNLQADIAVAHFTLNGTPAGALKVRLLWQSTAVQFTSFNLQMPNGSVSGTGTLALAGAAPRYRFTGKLNGLHWHGGDVAAEGRLEMAGYGARSLANIRGEGTFTGEDVAVSNDDVFSSAAGSWTLTMADGWPDLRLSSIQASQNDEAWTGEASSDSDGKLVLDMERAGHQRRIVSTLQSVPAPGASNATAISGLR